ncbi:hypothetical protein BBD41_20045 [Paenibacillus ihbetae]|uniref:DUF2569 domain-containing protein n=1 Tax=Paenibacillus ihbetae TaxID=1870820 RepID=A0A1B2E3X9_9BACL|nr:DUF2569 domain-containing protein [Paenibacillus ihbetae]ANY74673.1 hypothetical protein BBD41_20045 [Paenibacillus ihbetae]
MDSNQVQENGHMPPLEPGKQKGYLLKPPVEGLGGWLILVQISIYFSLIAITALLITNVLPIYEPEIWDVLTDPSSPYYDAMLVPLILFETVMNIIFVIGLLIALVMMYNKKRAFPKLMIGYIIASLLFGIVDFAVASQIELLAETDDGQSLTQIVRSTIYACIWIPYFIRSERVRNTFVN